LGTNEDITFCERGYSLAFSSEYSFKFTVKQGTVLFNCDNVIDIDYYDKGVNFEMLPNGDSMIKLGLNFELLDGDKTKPIPYKWTVKVSLIGQSLLFKFIGCL
jgi:hypothetical protein